MDFISREKFLEWARGRGIAPDVRYEEPRCLSYAVEGADGRFWVFDPGDGRLEDFFAWAVEGLGAWSVCYVWPRGGVWRGDELARNRLAASRLAVRVGPAVPDGFSGAVRYGREEMGFLVKRLARRAREAVCVGDDLFVVPDHGEQLLGLDHHHVVHVECAGEEGMRRFVEHMGRGGYRLPEELPDWTFKRPGWMA